MKFFYFCSSPLVHHLTSPLYPSPLLLLCLTVHAQAPHVRATVAIFAAATDTRRRWKRVISTTSGTQSCVVVVVVVVCVVVVVVVRVEKEEQCNMRCELKSSPTANTLYLQMPPWSG